MIDDERPTTRPEGDEPVVLTRRQLDALLDRIDRLERERSAPTPPSDPTGPAAGPPIPTPGPARVGRRRALVGLAGAAAAGTAATLAPSTPAAAADDDPVLLGRVNTASEATEIRVSGESPDLPHHGFAVLDGAQDGGESFNPAIYALARDERFSVALRAVAVGDAEIAVQGATDDGVAGEFFTDSAINPAVVAHSEHIGVHAHGPRGQVLLDPEVASPLGLTGTGFSGTLYSQATPNPDGDGTLWACVRRGDPGTWRKLAGHDTAGALHLLPVPVRVYDSRPTGLPLDVGPKTPLPAGNGARTLDLKAAGSGVPAGATGVLVTVLLVNAASGAGNFTIWSADRPKPVATTLVWGGTAGRFSTSAVTAVDAQARVTVDASLQTNLALDVVGYYR